MNDVTHYTTESKNLIEVMAGSPDEAAFVKARDLISQLRFLADDDRENNAVYNEAADRLEDAVLEALDREG